MTSHAQAGQDEFVMWLLGYPKKGFFVDIGAGFPVHYSNTYALERVGWDGVAFDREDQGFTPQRVAFLYKGDVTQMDLSGILNIHVPDVFEYLSLDVDSDTWETLAALPLDRQRFKVATIEHDLYQYGEKIRLQEREFLSRLGYDLVCGDVTADLPDGRAVAFEDWWVDPGLVDMGKVNRLRSNGLHYQEILARMDGRE